MGEPAMRSRIVAFVYPDSIEVFRRIDHGNGRIVYRRVPVTVVKPAAGWVKRGWSAVVSVAVNMGMTWLGA